MIRVFTAFSGYDSQCMALDRIGIDYDLVGWSEIDRYAIAAHNAIYPQYASRNYGDISRIDWAQVPDFDLLTYSSPCQDFSIAGRQHGGERGSGTRSSLLWECQRAIAAKRPRYLLFENVSALVSKKFVRLFNEWQLTLERLGYTNFTQVLNARDYGVPQNRERVFMVSVLDCSKTFYFPEKIPLTKCLRDVLEDNAGKEYYLSDRMINTFNRHTERYKDIGGFGWKPTDGSGVANTVLTVPLRPSGNFVIQRGHGYNKGGEKDIAPAITTSSYAENNVLQNGDKIRKLTPTECFRLMGVSDKDIKKICAAVSKTQSYKLAGNSIVVDVLALIFSQLFRGNKNKHQQTEIF